MPAICDFKFLPIFMRPFTLFAFVAAAFPVTPVFAGWPRLPVLESKPVGMEMAYSGTSLQSAEGIQDASSLLAGDLSRAVKLSPGQAAATLKFAKQSVVRQLSFINEGVSGKVSLAISSDNSTWSSLADAVFAPKDRLVKIDVGSAQGRYVRLEFEVSKVGSVRGLQLIGGDHDTDYEVTQEAQGTGAPVNFATGLGGGRLIYLSENRPGAGLTAMETNVLEFSAPGDKQKTAVYDLGEIRSITEFVSVHSSCPAKFAVYAFDQLPEKENWRGRMSFDPGVFANATPVGVVEDRSGRGALTVKPVKAVKARYIALSWEINVTSTPFMVYGISIVGNAYVCCNRSDVFVTTGGGSNGKPRTSVQLGDGRVVETDRASSTALAAVGPDMLRLGRFAGGAMGGYGASWFPGKGGASQPGARPNKIKVTEEGADELADSDYDTAIHILWCPVASSP